MVAYIASFDMFDLFVNYVFGNIFLAMFGIMLMYLIIGIIGRMSMQSMIVILIFFLAIMMVGYIGALASIPLFIFCTWYFLVGLINWINTMR